MSGLRRAVYLAMSFAALAAAIAIMSTTARAQSDPFGALYAPPPGSGPAPSTKTGVTSVTGAVGRSYAGSQEGGFASLAQIGMLPKAVPAMPVALKAWNPKFAAGRPRVVAPTYVLGLVRTGKVSASAAGRGSDITPRRTTLTTALVGIPDDLAETLADEAHADLLKRLRDAGFDVVPPEQVQASAEIARLAPVGTRAKGANGWTIYGPAAAPLRAGHAWSPNPMSASKAAMVFNDVSAELDAVVLTPQLLIDYQQLEGTGQRTYVGSAQVGAKVWFSIVNGSGAQFLYGKRKGLGGGMPGSFVTQGHGTAEPFAIMYEVDDRSDSVAVHNAFVQAGMGSLYRQSQVYAVEASPDRYAALVRAAYQGLNMSIVAELKTARGL